MTLRPPAGELCSVPRQGTHDAVIPVTVALRRPVGDIPLDEAQLAVAAFLARYQGRTLDAYRYDLRAFFQGPPMLGSRS